MKNKLIIPFYDIEGNLSEEILLGELTPTGLFTIKEIPLFIPNLALNDIVAFENEEGRLFFEKLIKSSGNTTIHVILLQSPIDELFINVKKNNGIIRKFNNKYFAINFKMMSDYLKLKPILDLYEAEEKISYKEACLGNL